MLSHRGARPADAGIGLVEVVVTLFLLSLISIAFLPFLLNSYVAARENAARSTASTLVGDALSRLRADLVDQDHDCAWVEDWVIVNAQHLEVDGGTDLDLAGTVDCPDALPGAATVAFTATDDDGVVLGSASTRVYVVE